MTPPDRSCERPRVAGAREDEILEATVAQLLEVGYDRLTMDRVAEHARASKATLYRRWSTKQALVVDALERSHHHTVIAGEPDTGSLRSDLLALFAAGSGFGGESVQVFGVVITALQIDPEFATQQEIYRRAAERGELHPAADPALLAPALPGILLHRALALGDPVTPELVERVVDTIILPAATGRPPSTPQETP
jgi:AcrR family transcriptional regulator